MKVFKIIIIAFLLLFVESETIAQTLTTSKMNLKELHTESKSVQTKMIFPTTEGKVISLQILKDNQLKEHTTTVPALLVCVKGEAVFENEKGISVTLLSGDFINIEPNVKHWVNAKTDCNLLLIK